MASLLSILLRVANKMGYQELRAKQQEAILAFMRGLGVFVTLLTGCGKSLCYSILPGAFNAVRSESGQQSIAIIVSPLISLMKDQVKTATERNVTAVYVGDAKSTEVRKICEGEYQLVFMSPKSLLQDSTWRDMLLSPVYQQQLIAFVVNEAHCVKKW